MVSNNARCLLNDSPDSPTVAQLVSYCDFNQITTYRLDKEMAIVIVSAVERKEPGSASQSASGVVAESEQIIATAEHIEKVSRDEKQALVASMTLEWQSVLTSISDETALPKRLLSSTEPDYWEQGRSKLRRLMSEPFDPKMSSMGCIALN